MSPESLTRAPSAKPDIPALVRARKSHGFRKASRDHAYAMLHGELAAGRRRDACAARRNRKRQADVAVAKGGFRSDRSR